jgi:pilus assembly protein CpaC
MSTSFFQTVPAGMALSIAFVAAANAQMPQPLNAKTAPAPVAKRSTASRAVLLASATAPSAPSAAAMSAPEVVPTVTVAPMAIQAASSQNALHILLGQSLMMHDVNPLRRIYVGNPAILQTFTSGPEEVIVTAKAAGVSTLVVWDTQDHTTMYTVYADLDTSGLRDALRSAYPNQTIDASGVQDHVTLAGTVPTKDMADGAVRLAGFYAKDVVSSLQVVPIHGKQVELQLKVAEVDRSKIDQFGINIAKATGSSIGTITTGQFPSTITQSGSGISSTVTASNALNFLFYNFHHGIGVTLQDLESANLLQILAEPTLTTMSGKSAKFLSGGEFPIPIVQGGTSNSTAISIEFKPYGVKVDFLPIVNADGTIHLTVTPEVSTLDYANAVTIQGFTIPALATRRSETEVELRDGQTFILSGLLNHTTTDALSKIPGISDIPILGQLFRTKSLNHGVSELIILCTARVVDPLHDQTAPTVPKFPVPPLEQPRFDKDVQREEKAYPAGH